MFPGKINWKKSAFLAGNVWQRRAGSFSAHVSVTFWRKDQWTEIDSARDYVNIYLWGHSSATRLQNHPEWQCWIFILEATIYFFKLMLPQRHLWHHLLCSWHPSTELCSLLWMPIVWSLTSLINEAKSVTEVVGSCWVIKQNFREKAHYFSVLTQLTWGC